MAEEREPEDLRVGLIQHARGQYIKKRALKNKALSVSFNDKDLRDYVTGFHKRKKKRRKEAHQQLEEKARLKRIENRKKRKQDRQYVQFGDVQPANDAGPDESGDDLEQDEETEPSAPVSGMETYDNGDMTIIVKTSEISREEEDNLSTTCLVPRSSESDKKHNIPVTKKKPMKVTGRRKSFAKPKKKREKRMGKKKRI